MDSRATEWLQERARLQRDLRTAQAEIGSLQKRDEANRARAARAQERLDVLTQSLRTHPPPPSHGVAAPLLGDAATVRRLSGGGGGGGAAAPAAAAVAAATAEGRGSVGGGWGGSAIPDEVVPALLHDQLQREVAISRRSHPGLAPASP